MNLYKGYGEYMDLISVIVPIYMVEAYLHCCVDSILDQSYKNLEIILVDDGSPDNCPAICDKYAEKDERVRVIHKKNGGLSDARNAGMLASTGEYLMFVDSDDWLEKGAVSLLYQLLVEYNAQIAVGGMQRVEDQTNIVLQSEFNGEKHIENMTKTQAMKKFFQNGCAAWGRLYHRSVHSGIKFPVGEINEDEAIVLPLLARCSMVVQTNEIVYNYRCRAESITTSAFSEKKLAWYRHCGSNLVWTKQHYPNLANYAEKRLCVSIMYSLHEIANADQDYQKYVQPLRNDFKLHYRDYRKLDWSNKEKMKLWAWRYIPYRILCLVEKRKA